VSLACARARAGLQARLDADPAQRVDGAEIDGHLAGCAECRAIARELQEVQDALRAAPVLRFPDAALEEVWDRTVRARQVTRLRRGLGVWSGLAAAGILGALLLAVPRGPAAPRGPSPEEVRRAAAEVEFVFRLTDQEIRHQGSRALSEVLDGEVAPALRAGERR
jgi:hypothetical protein